MAYFKAIYHNSIRDFETHYLAALHYKKMGENYPSVVRTFKGLADHYLNDFLYLGGKWVFSFKINELYPHANFRLTKAGTAGTVFFDIDVLCGELFVTDSAGVSTVDWYLLTKGFGWSDVPF